MLVTELNQKLDCFGMLINPKALSINYRALQLSPTHARACSAFGALETEIDLGLDKEIYIDGSAFLQVIKSLPSAQLELSVSDQSLNWKCGAARGQLALLSDTIEIARPELPKRALLAEVGDNFGKALELAALACGSTALLSIGLYGILLDNESALVGFASDNSTMSSARLGDKIKNAPEKCYLSPDAARLVSMLASKNKTRIFIEGEASLYVVAAGTKLVVKQVPPLKFDIKSGISAFREQQLKIDLNRDVVSSFIRRAEALAEEKGKATVAISVEDGAVKLSFAEGKSSSEEYYLAEGGPKGSVGPITVDSRRLARALSNAASVIFDYVSKEVLVLRGANDFVFVIAGKAVKTE